MSEIKVERADFGRGTDEILSPIAHSRDGWCVGIVGSAEKKNMSVMLCFSREYSDKSFEYFDAKFDRGHIKKLIRDLTNVVSDLEESS